MLRDYEKNEPTRDEARCDVKVWSPSCVHTTYTQQGDKYLCDSCGKIKDLNHEIGHDMFPHLKAEDESNLH
jgi:hypothetical protein